MQKSLKYWFYFEYDGVCEDDGDDLMMLANKLHKIIDFTYYILKNPTQWFIGKNIAGKTDYKYLKVTDESDLGIPLHHLSDEEYSEPFLALANIYEDQNNYSIHRMLNIHIASLFGCEEECGYERPSDKERIKLFQQLEKLIETLFIITESPLSND